MKRLLCIISSLSAGGAETFLMKISRSLPADEYQMDFIVSDENGCYTQEVLDRGGRIFAIPQRTKDFVGAFSGIRKVVRDNGYTTVLKLGENSLAAADLIAARLGGARVLALRSCNAPTQLSWKQRCIHRGLMPLLNRMATVKLAPSDLAAEYMFGNRAVRKEVCLLHNGVDLNVFHYDETGRQQIRREFHLEDRLVVGHIGRFHKQKNHEFLLEVFREIRKMRQDAVLLLVGIGELEDSIRQQVKEKGLEDAVIFAGQRFDIPQILSAMDVFVFPSFHEGMPNTVIEAQSTGLPCVIADTITKEADITGLVTYLTLSESPEYWASVALSAADAPRRDTSSDFVAHGYDIQSVSSKLLGLLDLSGEAVKREKEGEDQ